MIEKYTSQMKQAAHHVGHMLQEKEYALKFAGEFGYGLASCGATRKQVVEQCKVTYGGILVVCTGLKPPISMRQWAKAILEGYQKYE